LRSGRSNRLDTQVARRQIRGELRQHQQATKGAASYKVKSDDDLDLLGAELRQAGSSAWTKHSDRLARQLGDPDWDAVERAYESVARLVSIVRNERVPPSEHEFAWAQKAIDDAIETAGARGDNPASGPGTREG
jgi:hypothetical protein